MLADRVVRTLAGVDTVIAADGWEALRLLNTDHFDLVVLDMESSFIDGITLLKRCRGNANYAEVPILMLGSAHRSDRNRALAFGASGYMSKCLQARPLMAMFSKLLSR